MTEGWLSPMNRVIWTKAFRERASTVELRDGRKFDIRYLMQNVGVGRKSVRVVYVRPTGDSAFAPCGYFLLSKVTDELWLTESDMEGTPDNKYLKYLDQFSESALEGVNVIDHWPALEGLSSATLRAGFANAKSARGIRAESVQVLHQEGQVFLIREHDER